MKYTSGIDLNMFVRDVCEGSLQNETSIWVGQRMYN